MAATPFTGSISMKGISGDTYIESFVGSDVDGEFVTFDNTTLIFNQLPEPATIVDIQVDGTAADTVRLKLYVNGLDKGKSWTYSSVLDSINNRVPLPVNIGLPGRSGGPLLQLRQLA